GGFGGAGGTRQALEVRDLVVVGAGPVPVAVGAALHRELEPAAVPVEVQDPASARRSRSRSRLRGAVGQGRDREQEQGEHQGEGRRLHCAFSSGSSSVVCRRAWMRRSTSSSGESRSPARWFVERIHSGVTPWTRNATRSSG